MYYPLFGSSNFIRSSLALGQSTLRVRPESNAPYNRQSKFLLHSSSLCPYRLRINTFMKKHRRLLSKLFMRQRINVNQPMASE